MFHKLMLTLFSGLLVNCLLVIVGNAQSGDPKIGAYYFDGWSGTTFHITEDLKQNYPEREPVWGWVTSTQEIVDEQIKMAADVGLSFFSFCWYHSEKQEYGNIPLNRALNFYKASENVEELEYTLLVANHAGFEVGPQTWEEVKGIWLKEFQHPQYLKVDGKPLLIFFEYHSLIKNFGSPELVKAAFEDLKQQAVASGLEGVSVAICVGSPEQVKKAKQCGADIATGYNYHSAGFEGDQQEIPIEKMQTAERKIWTTLAQSDILTYIPVSTVGWDPRPWANERNNYLQKPYFTGFTAASVRSSVQGLVDWIRQNPNRITGEKIGLLYAWNENAEGAWLTPGKTGLNPSDGVKQVLKY